MSRIAAALVAAGLALTVLGMAAGLVTLAIGAIDPAMFAGLRGTMNGQSVDLADPQRLSWFGGIAFVACAAAALVLWQLLGMLRSAAAGTPFTARNVARLHILAALFAGYAVARMLAPLLIGAEWQTVLALEGPTLDLSPILMALVSVVLAEVFREGVGLREEAEGTV